jgi:hypothetical protein
MTDERLLGIYLNDHLAGATGGLELARRLHGSHRDTEHEPALAQLVDDVAADRETLVAIMDRFGISRARYKTGAAWVVEKAGRLKLNGHLLSRSPLSSLVEVEFMQIGVEGKASLWRTLRALAPYDERLDAAELDRLLGRARQQAQVLEDLRPTMTESAFVASRGPSG